MPLPASISTPASRVGQARCSRRTWSVPVGGVTARYRVARGNARQWHVACNAAGRTRYGRLERSRPGGSRPVSAGRPCRDRRPLEHLPNLITMARILCVPVIVWAITAGQMLLGLSAVPARRRQRRGGRLPGQALRHGDASSAPISIRWPTRRCWSRSTSRSASPSAMPRWLVIVVVSRDIMIVGAVVLSWLVDKPVTIQPHRVVEAQHRRRRSCSPALVLAALGLRRSMPAGPRGADGAGHGLDLAFDRLLCRGMDPSFRHERPRYVRSLTASARTHMTTVRARSAPQLTSPLTLRRAHFWLARCRLHRPAVAAQRHPAAVRRRHRARLSARSAGRPAGAARPQPR